MYKVPVRGRHINKHTEVKIGNCVFSKNDVMLMYIDSGESIQGFAKRIGVGRVISKKILDSFGITTSWKEEVTPRRLRVMRYILYHQQKYKRSPNLTEIGQALGVATSSICIHVKNLKKLGYIKNQKELELTDKGKEVCGNTNTFNIFCVAENG